MNTKSVQNQESKKKLSLPKTECNLTMKRLVYPGNSFLIHAIRCLSAYHVLGTMLDPPEKSQSRKLLYQDSTDYEDMDKASFSQKDKRLNAFI